MNINEQLIHNLSRLKTMNTVIDKFPELLDDIMPTVLDTLNTIDTVQIIPMTGPEDTILDNHKEAITRVFHSKLPIPYTQEDVKTFAAEIIQEIKDALPENCIAFSPYQLLIPAGVVLTDNGPSMTFVTRYSLS